MIILGINTATNKTEVALINGTRVLFEKSWQSNRDEAEKVLPAIQAALKKIGRGKTLDRIFVVHGPGPFTSLRVGVTIANTLGFIYQVPVISCDTFEYYRARLPAARQKDTAIILKAGGDFVAVLRPKDKKPKVIAIAALGKYVSGFKITGDLTVSNQEKIALPILPQKSLTTFASVLKKIATKKTPPQKIVEPTYLRPPKITESKKPLYTA